MNQHGAKAWLYHFEFPLENPVYSVLGDFHASELGFVFDTWVNPLSGNSKRMSRTFQNYWGNLATVGDVNGVDGKGEQEGFVFWPHHNVTGDYNLVHVLDVPASPQQHLFVFGQMCVLGCSLVIQVVLLCTYKIIIYFLNIFYICTYV